MSFLAIRPILRPRALRLPNLRLRPISRFASTIRNETSEVLPELKARGLVQSVAGDEHMLQHITQSTKITSYAGVDPTAPSLHVGNLLPLMSLLHLYLHGHNVIALVGQATVHIGDPSGRSTERSAQAADTLTASGQKIWRQLEGFFKNAEGYARERGYSPEKYGSVQVLSNWDWLGGMTLVDFLSTVGRNVRVGQMLARESVRRRMESSEGINFSEFTYQLLQSYDFWHLYNAKGCTVQIGGNDQFGNITAGMDLIGRLAQQQQDVAATGEQKPAFGLTVPILTTASGEKFGKSAGNAIFLDVTPFELYQYFYKLEDGIVDKFLRAFTLLPLDEIVEIVDAHMKNPDARLGQKKAAYEITALLHGDREAGKAERQTALLFPSSEADVANVTARDILDAFEGSDFIKQLPREDVVGKLPSQIVRATGVMSRSQVDNLIKQGGVYIGFDRRKKVEAALSPAQEDWLMDDKVLVLRLGKGKTVVIELI